MIDPVPVGEILKSHGVHGDLVAKVDEPYHNSMENCRALFIDIDGNIVPFMILQRKYLERGLWLLELKGVKSRSESTEFHGCRVFINKEELEDVGNTVLDRPDLTGFSIHHNLGSPIFIQKVEEYPQQIMLIGSYESGEDVMIPLVENWIESVDSDRKKISMKLPEGLI
ncbi:MAG: hypothetical protein R3275_06810 [Saprospiraceae bacterium]|nr:hypothetical protein [Saprospiraceae bacterium]